LRIDQWPLDTNKGGYGLINSLITTKARREFSRALLFKEGETPFVPPLKDAKPRMLYLHVPFCERLCPYCSFHRVVFKEGLCRDYFHALRKEIAAYREMGYRFGAMYIGGGTPTVLMDELIETIAFAREAFEMREISVETNPNHLTDERLTALRNIGVNRLSVGIQSFDDGLLKRMERYDYGSGAEIEERLRRTMGRFETLNADMIFNFPTQNAAMLDRDLDILLSIGVDQTTWYPLMVSSSTRKKVEKTLGMVDYRQEKLFYSQIVKRLIPSYRFSSAWCFSRGKAMIDEYIVDYDEYAGLGSGAIGYLSGVSYANTFDINAYIKKMESGKLPLLVSRVFSRRDAIRYDFMMKLFGTRLDIPVLKDKYGGSLRLLWPDIIAFFLAGGFSWKKPEIILTAKGRYYWVILMREFFIAVNNFRDFCRDQTDMAPDL
jgi:menaquinone C8-methyltransferase